MPAPISSASPNGPLGLAPSALTSFARTCALADRAVVDSPLGVVLGRGGVVVAGVDVLDLARRWRSGARASAGMVGARPARHYGPAPWKRPTCSETSPTGVPPLALTGERTLPDVPEENYWFRRHLAVYEWIAARVAGARVADLACGEGYGSDVLAGARRRGGRGRRQPRGARARAGSATGAPNLRFERGLVEAYDGPCDAIVFLQTIEHIAEPGALLEGFAARRRR